MCSASSRGALVGRIYQGMSISAGIFGREDLLSTVSSTGGRVVLPSRFRLGTKKSFTGVGVTGICHRCRTRVETGGTLSFSSLLMGAMRLLRARPSILRDCRREFHCVVMSRCRSAGAIRFRLMDLLTKGCGGLYIIKSSSRSVCGFHKTGVQGVLSFRRRFPSTGIVGLRRGCESAKGVLGTTGDIVTGGHKEGRGSL